MSLQQAIDHALSPESAAADPVAATGAEPEDSSNPLTTREREVAQLVAQGHTNRHIADRLSISERTVSTHVGRVLKKLELRSRAQLATWIARQKDPASDQI